jgi:hypothetical protein
MRQTGGSGSLGVRSTGIAQSRSVRGRNQFSADHKQRGYTMRYLLTTLALVTSPAFSQAALPNCANVADAIAGLAANYGEAPRVTALMTGGNMLIITAAPGGGWTALEVKPGGEACIVAAGEAFAVQDAEPPGDDS